MAFSAPAPARVAALSTGPTHTLTPLVRSVVGVVVALARGVAQRVATAARGLLQSAVQWSAAAAPARQSPVRLCTATGTCDSVTVIAPHVGATHALALHGCAATTGVWTVWRFQLQAQAPLPLQPVSPPVGPGLPQGLVCQCDSERSHRATTWLPVPAPAPVPVHMLLGAHASTHCRRRPHVAPLGSPRAQAVRTHGAFRPQAALPVGRRLAPTPMGDLTTHPASSVWWAHLRPGHPLGDRVPTSQSLAATTTTAGSIIMASLAVGVMMMPVMATMVPVILVIIMMMAMLAPTTGTGTGSGVRRVHHATISVIVVLIVMVMVAAHTVRLWTLAHLRVMMTVLADPGPCLSTTSTTAQPGVRSWCEWVPARPPASGLSTSRWNANVFNCQPGGGVTVAQLEVRVAGSDSEFNLKLDHHHSILLWCLPSTSTTRCSVFMFKFKCCASPEIIKCCVLSSTTPRLELECSLQSRVCDHSRL